MVAGTAAAGVGEPGAGAPAERLTDDHEPVVSLSLNGGGIGGYRVVDGEATLEVMATVGPGASEGTELRTVSARVNGRTERSYDPQSPNASVSVDLPLRRGNNSVRVVVEDTDDALAERRIVVARDDVALWIGLTSPYHADRRAVVPNGTVDRSLATFAVDPSDFSGIRRGTISVDHERGSDTAAVRDPGLAFERDLLLGYGNNSVEIHLEDRIGNGRTERFWVEDESPPEVALDLYPTATTAASIDLSGRLRDNVWVRNASVTVEHLDVSNTTGNVNYTAPLRRDTPYEYARGGRNVSFEKRLLLRHGTNRIELTARDHLGQTTNRTIEIERVRSPWGGENDSPAVHIDPERTELLGDGRVRIVANVTGPDWNLDAVAIETESLTSGELLDYERFGDLDSRRSLAVETTLGAADGSTVVRVRASDAESARTVERRQFAPETETETATLGREEPAAATETATPTPDRDAIQRVGERDVVVRRTTPRRLAAVRGLATVRRLAPGRRRCSLVDLPLIGGLSLAGIADALATAAPFVVGGLVVATVAYFVLRRVRGGENAS